MITCKHCGEPVERDGDEWSHTHSDRACYEIDGIDTDNEITFAEPEPLTEWEAQEKYSDLLDEIYGTVEIAGLEYDTSRAVKYLDPVAFRAGMLDYLSAEGLEIA